MPLFPPKLKTDDTLVHIPGVGTGRAAITGVVEIPEGSNVSTIADGSITADMLESGALTIANDSVTYAKMQNASQACFIGATGAGDLEERTYANVISDLGLVIGTDVQAYDAQLSSLAALSYAGNANKYIRVNAGETDFELATVTGGSGLTAAQVGARAVGSL